MTETPRRLVRRRVFVTGGGSGIGRASVLRLAAEGAQVAVADKRPDIVSFVPCVSRPTEDKNSDWEGAKGRVNHIVEDQIAKFGLNKEDTLIYACGHPGMIEDVKARFVPQGWNFEEERFWK